MKDEGADDAMKVVEKLFGDELVESRRKEEMYRKETENRSR